jgi:hypothetical protein
MSRFHQVKPFAALWSPSNALDSGQWLKPVRVSDAGQASAIDPGKEGRRTRRTRHTGPSSPRYSTGSATASHANDRARFVRPPLSRGICNWARFFDPPKMARGRAP